MNTSFAGASGLEFHGGMFNNATNLNIYQSKRGIDLLLEFIAADALHNSADQYDAPKCHPRTRVAVLEDIIKWVMESDAQDEFVMWLYGPAGAGKSAIARKIAELAAEQGLLIGTFFFSRTSPTRSTLDRVIATLAYQLAVSIPATRTHIQDVIERDPAIFKKSLHTQIDTLVIRPFQYVSTDNIGQIPKLIVIDGLDECTDSQAQMALLDAISYSFTIHKLPLRCLVVSRPEIDLVTAFNGNEALKSIHRRLALDDNYHPDDDIRVFFSDKFEQIRCTHRLRSTIPIPWPTAESLDTLIEKSSGQFIFAATVVRFVESNRHQPAARLNIILGISPPGTIKPFTELDALYKQILSSVDDIQLTLRVLSLYALLPGLGKSLDRISMTEQFLYLEEGDIDRALIDLSSLVSYNALSGEAKVLHASLVDFLSDPYRSDEFYIDMARARTDSACRAFQYIKGPDGILAGDCEVFYTGITGGWILTSQLMNEILNFDLDAFITAAIKSPRRHDIWPMFARWVYMIPEMGLDDGTEQLLTQRWTNTFESRVQKYQSDCRLQLLFTLALRMPLAIRNATCLDILLEIDDPALHLVDRDALYFRSSNGCFIVDGSLLDDIASRYLDGDIYASAALHCIRFLSNPPKYSDGNGSPEMGIAYAEWQKTCQNTLELFRSLLKKANTSAEIMQYMSDHDISTMVQKHCHDIEIWRVYTYILEFLSRGGVCVNWRIISAIRRGLCPTNKYAMARLQSRGMSDSCAEWWWVPAKKHSGDNKEMEIGKS